MPVYPCLWKPEVDIFCGYSLQLWGTGSFTELGVHLLCRMTGQKASWVCISDAGIAGACYHAQLFYVGRGTVNPAPHACGKGFT